MEKTFIKLNSDGNATSVFTTNSKNIILKKNTNAIEITNHKYKDKILNKPNYFKLKDNKIIELSKVEKEKSDKPLLPPKPVSELKSILDEIKKINDRLNILEKKNENIKNN